MQPLESNEKLIMRAFEDYLNLVKRQEINRHGKECSLDELQKLEAISTRIIEMIAEKLFENITGQTHHEKQILMIQNLQRLYRLSA